MVTNDHKLCLLIPFLSPFLYTILVASTVHSGNGNRDGFLSSMVMLLNRDLLRFILNDFFKVIKIVVALSKV